MKKVLSLILVVVLVVGLFPSITFSASEYINEKIDSAEDLEVGTNLKVNGAQDFCAFGTGAGTALVSDTRSHTGQKSICLSGRTGGGGTLKIKNLFGRTLTDEDVGKTFRISFYVYPDSTKPVYKSTPDSTTTDDEFTTEELKQSKGAEFTVYLAGPDAKSYKYRTGVVNTHKFFAEWDKWTEINYYYTVEKQYLPTGSTEELSDPYLNAIRVGQSKGDDVLGSAIADTFYVDDVKVSEVGARFYTNIKDGVAYVSTVFTENCRAENARTIIFEYSKDKVLKGVRIGDSVVTKSNAFLGDNLLTYDIKDNDSEIFVSCYGGLYSDPIAPISRVYHVDIKYGYDVMSNATLRAKEMLELSTADYKDALSYEERLDKDNEYFFSVDDTYSRKSTPDEVRNVSEVTVKTGMDGFFKFDISKSEAKSVSGAYLLLYTQSVNDKDGTINIHTCSNDWSEKTLTHNNKPEAGKIVSSFTPIDIRVVHYADVTSYINQALKDNKDTLSFCLKSEDAYITIAAKEYNNKSFKPQLIFEGVNEEEGSRAVSSFDYSNYVDVMKRKKTPADNFEKTPTRIMSSLKDYTPVTQAPKLNKYGSWIDGGKYEATGFFRKEFIDGRWWIIDPEGYKQLHIAVSRVEAEKSDKFDGVQKKAFEAKYGTDENWANMVVDELVPYGFNGIGPWSDYHITLKATEKEPMVVAGFKPSFIKGYDKDDDNMLDVFDPEFETYADSKAKEWFAPYADDPHILGWITDNEPMANDNMLLSYLTCDPATHIYNYYTAWEWLRDRHGEDAQVDDITDEDKCDWVEFVYDRYMKVCTDAIRKYDTNHMIIGPKLDKPHKGSFRGLKKWVDIIAYDYYGNAWTADMAQVEQWYLWGGKPLINAEWYVKGMDAITDTNDLTNESGVGYTVLTQQERGHYYHSFVLNMLESKAFVGWQWFRYTDNLGGPSTADSGPDLNSNKGIYTRDYKPHTTILESMKDININVYSLINYFDK